jgi:glycosyltransferase involved in cell wall biosynthesis
MRILRSYVAVTPSPGGMERHIAELSTRQRKTGVEVVQVYSAGHVEAGLGIKVLAGWPILHLRPHAARDLIFYTAVLLRVWRRRIRCDILHIHGDWSAFLFGSMLRRVVGARVLAASVHGHLRQSRWSRPLYRLVLRDYAVIYATGPRETRLLTEWTGRSCKWFTSGVSECFLDARRSQGGRCDVLVVGSIVPVKGMELVVDTARLMPNRRFRIVGDGPERLRIQALATRAGVTNLEFAGSLPIEALVEEYAGAGVLLLTSHEEGMPTAMLEGMAMGLPVVTTRSNDYSELLGDGEGGTIVDTRDGGLISRAIEIYLTDHLLAAKVAERNRRVARLHSWDTIAQRVTGIMRSALNEARSR